MKSQARLPPPPPPPSRPSSSSSSTVFSFLYSSYDSTQCCLTYHLCLMYCTLIVGATVVRTNPALAAAQPGGVNPEAIAAAVAAATKAIMSPRGSPSPRSPHHSSGQLDLALSPAHDPASDAAPLLLPPPMPQGSPLRGDSNRINSHLVSDDGSDTSSSNAPPSPPVAAIAGQRPGLPQGAHDPHIDWRSGRSLVSPFSSTRSPFQLKTFPLIAQSEPSGPCPDDPTYSTSQRCYSRAEEGTSVRP